MPKRVAERGENRAPRILVVEDDEILGSNLARFISERMGWKVDLAIGVKAGRGLLERSKPYDVLVSDTVLRDGNGLDLAIQARPRGTKIILMTGVVDRGIRHGSADLADAYLPKPFHLADLSAKLTELTDAKPATPARKEMPLVCLDAGSRVLFRGEVLPLKLTRTEASIMQEFVSHFGDIVLKESLFERVYSERSEYGNRKLDVHLHNLRKKLEEASDNEVEISTIRSQGFVLKLTSSELPQLVEGKPRRAKQP